MEEVAHFQGALMLWDEIGNGAWQAVTTGQFQSFIHMRLQHRCTAKWIIQGVVGVGFVLLILDEPPRGMQFAHVVLKRAGAN